MQETEEDLSAFNEADIPDAMRGDPLKNTVLSEIDCSAGPMRQAAFQTYRLIEGLYCASRKQNFVIHPRVVLRAYDLIHDRQRGEARKFTLLHVLLRGIYAQLWLESNEDYGARYQTIYATNSLIDETIQWAHSQRRSR